MDKYFDKRVCVCCYEWKRVNFSANEYAHIIIIFIIYQTYRTIYTPNTSNCITTSGLTMDCAIFAIHKAGGEWVLSAKRSLHLILSECNQTKPKSARTYDTDISLAFTAQLLSFRSNFHSKLSAKSAIFEIAQLLHVDSYAQSSIVSDVCTAYMLLLALLMTLATCERSFFQNWTSLKTPYEVPCLKSGWATWQSYQWKMNVPDSLLIQKWWLVLLKRRRAPKKF